MTDDLDTLLGPVDAGVPSNRDALLASTTRILRRRFLVRRVASLAAVAIVFALGAAAGWLAKPQRIEREIVEVQVTPAPVAPKPVEPRARTAGELELLAELADDKGDIARLYREAGDQYLAARDYPQASRCYRLHLHAASGAEQKVSTTDSWLLMSMKSSTAKEISHANSGS